MKTMLQICAFLLASTSLCFADVVPRDPEALRREFRETRVGIVTGAPSGAYIQLGADLQKLVEGSPEAKLRVLTTVGRGSVGNLQDLLYLDFTDFALVQADVLLSIKQGDPAQFAYLKEHVAYVARLHPEIVHILARGGPFTGPEDLRGKTIAIGDAAGGTAITAPIVLRDLLKIDFRAVPTPPAEAFNNLLSENPSIDAFVYVAGRGAPLFSNLSEEETRRVQELGVGFVPLPPPPAGTPYQAVSIGDRDYPSLVYLGETVPGWAVPAVLAVYDWGSRNSPARDLRARKAEAFVKAFFDRRQALDDGPGGYNENWCDVDVGSPLEGWTRMRAAQDWLDANPDARTRICATQPQSLRALLAEASQCRAFQSFLRQIGMTPESLPEPAARFAAWRANNPDAC